MHYAFWLAAVDSGSWPAETILEFIERTREDEPPPSEIAPAHVQEFFEAVIKESVANKEVLQFWGYWYYAQGSGVDQQQVLGRLKAAFQEAKKSPAYTRAARERGGIKPVFEQCDDLSIAGKRCNPHWNCSTFFVLKS